MGAPAALVRSPTPIMLNYLLIITRRQTFPPRPAELCQSSQDQLLVGFTGICYHQVPGLILAHSWLWLHCASKGLLHLKLAKF